MEIKVGERKNQAAGSEVAVPPDRGHYLRRNTAHKLRKRQAGSRRLVQIYKSLGRLTAVLMIVSFGAYLFSYTYSSGRFELRNISIEGCKELDAKDLEEMIIQNFRSNILRIDLPALRSRLEEEAWVERAEIRRILPSALVIYIRERKPSVIGELSGELILTDNEGVLLDTYDPKYGKLDVPVFRGLLGNSIEEYRLHQEENSRRIELGLKVLTDLESGSPSFARKISEIDLSDRSNVRVLLVDDTVEVFLGDKEFLKRFSTFMSNMDKYQELRAEYQQISSVDLRFDGKIIYRPSHLSEMQSEYAPEVKP